MAFDTEIAVITIFCEASSLSQAAREGVAHVILNRVADGRWGKTVAEVCLSRKQFSEWNGDPVNNRNLLRAAKASINDPGIKAALEAFQTAQWKSSPPLVVDPTGGATHFYDERALPVPPSWAKPPAEVTARINSIVFLKNVS